jgi:ribosome-binding factor A
MSRRTARAPSQRQLRVGEELRHALAIVLERDRLRDPVLQDAILTVTEVRASPDLRRATVYVARLGGETDDAVIEALTRARPFLRRQMASAVNLKYAPDLDFVADRSFEQAGHIDKLLQDPAVAADLAAPEVDENGDGDDSGS